MARTPSRLLTPQKLKRMQQTAFAKQLMSEQQTQQTKVGSVKQLPSIPAYNNNNINREPFKPLNEFRNPAARDRDLGVALFPHGLYTRYNDDYDDDDDDDSLDPNSEALVMNTRRETSMTTKSTTSKKSRNQNFTTPLSIKIPTAKKSLPKKTKTPTSSTQFWSTTNFTKFWRRDILENATIVVIVLLMIDLSCWFSWWYDQNKWLLNSATSNGKSHGGGELVSAFQLVGSTVGLILGTLIVFCWDLVHVIVTSPPATLLVVVCGIIVFLVQRRSFL